MLIRGWGAKKTEARDGFPERNSWKIIDGGAPSPDQMMMNVDMCMAYDNNPIHSKCMIENGFNNRKCRRK